MYTETAIAPPFRLATGGGPKQGRIQNFGKGASRHLLTTTIWCICVHTHNVFSLFQFRGCWFLCGHRDQGWAKNYKILLCYSVL